MNSLIPNVRQYGMRVLHSPHYFMVSILTLVNIQQVMQFTVSRFISGDH